MKNYNNMLLGLTLSLVSLTTSVAMASDVDLDTDLLGTDSVLSIDELDVTSGRGDLQQQESDVDQGATLSDNSLVAGETGGNQIDASSFTNLQGIAHVIQNTGNNVIIQDSTTFNVQFVDAAN